MLSTWLASADDRSKIEQIWVKTVKIWKHHEKYVEIRTNMPAIGSLIGEDIR